MDFNPFIKNAILLAVTGDRKKYGLAISSPTKNNFLITVEFWSDPVTGTAKCLMKLNSKFRDSINSAYFEWFNYLFGA